MLAANRSLTRLDAIQDIRIGRGISNSFVEQVLGDGSGRTHTFTVIVRRDHRGGCVALIDCKIMRKTYRVSLTWRQTLAYIRLHYPKYTDKVLEEVA